MATDIDKEDVLNALEEAVEMTDGPWGASTRHVATAVSTPSDSLNPEGVRPYLRDLRDDGRVEMTTVMTPCGPRDGWRPVHEDEDEDSDDVGMTRRAYFA